MALLYRAPLGCGGVTKSLLMRPAPVNLKCIQSRAHTCRDSEVGTVHCSRRSGQPSISISASRQPGRRIAATIARAVESQQASATEVAKGQGRKVVEAFYEAYNTRDLDTISSLIADDISYHDLVYPEPHEGRAGVMAWLQKVRQYAPDDLKFVIEDITDGDPYRVGVMWHVECGDGIFFPFSRGCSFIKLNPEGKIVQVRDVVEPAMKPGDSTLELLGALTPLIRAAGPEATSPKALNRLPAQAASAAVWALYVGYMSIVMFSTVVPGAPAWQTPPDVFAEIFDESLNIWWINEGLTALNLSFVPLVKCPPVSEGLFNFVITWAFIFLPAVFTDGPSKKINNKAAWFTGMMFLTNVFFIPFMALRAAPEPLPSTGTTTTGSSSSSSSEAGPLPAPGEQQLPGYAPAVGWFGMAMGLFSIGWALVGRPEYGDLATRAHYFVETANSNRVFWAFLLDLGLFYTWQLSFMEKAPAVLKYTPYFGLAGWLISGGNQQQQQQQV